MLRVASIAIYWIKQTGGREPIWFEESELDLFSNREQVVLRMRSQMDDRIEHTYDQIGAVINVTRERVRALINWVLTKLKHQREAERLETRAVARAMPPLPGKAKIDVKAARRSLNRGRDKPWRFPKEPEAEDYELQPKFAGVSRPAPQSKIKEPGGPPGRQMTPSMFGMLWLPGAGLYLQRYGLLVPANSYSAGRTDPGDGKVSVLPAWWSRRQTMPISATS
jgi:DNA-binding CsgD family transcriptional regulator